MFEELDKKFDVAPTLPDATETVEAAPPTIVLTDEEVSRQALRDIIEKGRDAIDEVINLAKSSESPRAYEVLAEMIKTVSDSSKDLLLLQKIKKDAMREKKSDAPRTQNNLFLGTTTELMKMMKQHEDAEVLEITPAP